MAELRRPPLHTNAKVARQWRVRHLQGLHVLEELGIKRAQTPATTML